MIFGWQLFFSKIHLSTVYPILTELQQKNWEDENQETRLWPKWVTLPLSNSFGKKTWIQLLCINSGCIIFFRFYLSSISTILIPRTLSWNVNTWWFVLLKYGQLSFVGFNSLLPFSTNSGLFLETKLNTNKISDFMI